MTIEKEFIDAVERFVGLIEAGDKTEKTMGALQDLKARLEEIKTVRAKLGI